jgi:hypothetical protein
MIKLVDFLKEDTQTYTYKLDPKTKKYDVLKVKGGTKVTSFDTEDKAKQHVDKINKLDSGYASIKGKVHEDEDVSISESQLNKNITDKIITIFHKKYGKYPKIKEIIEAWLSDSDNWKKAYYTSGENYKNDVLKPIEDKIRQWGKTSIFKNRPAFNSYNDISEGSEQYNIGDIYKGAGGTEYKVTPTPDKYKSAYGVDNYNVWVTDMSNNKQHFVPISILKNYKKVEGSISEGSEQIYTIEITAKNGKKTTSKVPASSPVELNGIVAALKKSKNVASVKVLKVEGSISKA